MKEHILVVEDNALSRELLCDWLETENFQVTSAASRMLKNSEIL